MTGIVRKPVEGAKKEGVEGFFKGNLCCFQSSAESSLLQMLTPDGQE